MRIPRNGDQRSELMSITIPKWVRVFDGVTDPQDGSRENLLDTSNRISQIAERWNNNNWLPIVDAFRTFVVCPPPVIRAVFQRARELAAA